MAEPEKTKRSSGANAENMQFEEALKKLEEIVNEMESGELTLEQMIARYEEGAKLARICQERLSEAELKIQQLDKKLSGEFQLKPIKINSGQPVE